MARRIRSAGAAPRRHVRDCGQAAVEFALALPLLVVALLGVAQVVDLAADRLAVGAAARAGARAAAAASSSANAAATAALGATGTRPLDISVSESNGTVTVTVTHVNPTSVPLVGSMIGDVTVSAAVTMPVEPP